MAEPIWSDEALDQLAAIVTYLDGSDPAAAWRIGTALLTLAQSLSDFPNRGRPIAGGRRELTTVPPYVLVYRARDDAVTILTIRHGRQRPDR